MNSSEHVRKLPTRMDAKNNNKKNRAGKGVSYRWTTRREVCNVQRAGNRTRISPWVEIHCHERGLNPLRSTMNQGLKRNFASPWLHNRHSMLFSKFCAAVGVAGIRRAAARRALEALCSGSPVLAALRSMRLPDPISTAPPMH